MKWIIFFLFTISNLNCKAQKSNYLDSQYNVLIESIFYDSIVLKSGSLVPFPQEKIQNFGKQNIIHIAFKERENIASIIFIKNEFKSNVIFVDPHKSISKFKNNITDTSLEIYSNSNYHVLGTIMVTGIYIPQKKEGVYFNELYFDIIRIGWKSKKSQINQIVRLIKKNEKWIIDKTIIVERS